MSRIDDESLEAASFVPRQPQSFRRHPEIPAALVILTVFRRRHFDEAVRDRAVQRPASATV